MKKYRISILILLVFLIISIAMISNFLINGMEYEKMVMILMSDSAIASVYYLMLFFSLIPFYFMLTIFLRYVQNTLSHTNLYRLIRQSTMKKAQGEVVVAALLISVLYISLRYLVTIAWQGSFTISVKILLQALLQIEIVGAILILSAFLLGRVGVGIASFSGLMIYIIGSITDKFLVSKGIFSFIWGSLIFIKSDSSGIELLEINEVINIFIYGVIFTGLAWGFYRQTTDLLLETQKGEQR